MAEADKKATIPRFLRLPQVAELIGREELQFALEEGHLPAWDRANRVYFEEFAQFLIGFVPGHVPQADLDAMLAIRGGRPIPPQSWRRWFWDGVVDFKTGEIIRPFVDRDVVLQPELRSEHIFVLVAAAPIAAVAQSAAKTSTAPWIIAEAQRLKADGKIPNHIGITDFARLLAERMKEAAKTDESLRPVGWRHIKNELPGWGLWPVSLIKS